MFDNGCHFILFTYWIHEGIFHRFLIYIITLYKYKHDFIGKNKLQRTRG